MPQYQGSPGGSQLAVASQVVANQVTDFTQSGAQAAFLQLGDIAPSITVQQGSRVRATVSGQLSTTTPDDLTEVRLNVDNGASFVQLGRIAGHATGMNLTATALVAGLAPGAHSFKYEYKKPGAGTLNLRCTSQPAIERFAIILEEIPA